MLWHFVFLESHSVVSFRYEDYVWLVLIGNCGNRFGAGVASDLDECDRTEEW